MLWSSRLVCLAIALWWPAVWCDPIYTPRQARLSGQELRLPDGRAPHGMDDQALAIFWNWQRRTLVENRWGLGPFRGLRDPQGRMQTLLVIVIVWGIGSGVLFYRHSETSASPAAAPESSPRGRWLTTPLWKLVRVWLDRRAGPG